MATLHQAIDLTRNTLKWGGILIGGIFLAITIFRGGIFLKDYFFPKAPPPPTVKFGILPKMTFPKSTSSKNFSYSVNTITGSLPHFPDRLNVYQIEHEEPKLLNLNRARAVAANIGIKAPETRISDTVYSWSDVELFSRKLIMDIVTSNFIYTTDFLSYTPLTSSQNQVDQRSMQRTAQDFLARSSSSSTNMSKTKTSLYRISDNKLVRADNISEAQLARVDFFFGDVDKLPIYSTSPVTSPINLLVSNFNGGIVIEANYYNHNITKVSATYPIKTADEAFKELSEGKGYIAADFNPGSNKKSIRNVLLAYYLSDKKVDYLMPIIVFTDNDGFYAYVSAIDEGLIR